MVASPPRSVSPVVWLGAWLASAATLALLGLDDGDAGLSRLVGPLIVLFPGWVLWATLFPALDRLVPAASSSPSRARFAVGTAAIVTSQSAIATLLALAFGWTRPEMLGALGVRAAFDLAVCVIARSSTRHSDSAASEDDSPNRAPASLERLPLRSTDRTRFLDVESIEWIQAEDQYARIHTADETHLVSMSLSSLADQLDPASFFRAHRSALVNLRSVREVRSAEDGRPVAIVGSGAEIPLARGRRRKLEQLAAALPRGRTTPPPS